MRQLRALVSFQDPHLRSGMQDVLELENYEVMACEQADHISLLKEQFRPDIVIAWVYFNQVYRNILEACVMHNIPTIFVSSFPILHHRQAYRGYDQNIAFLQIPFDAEELLTTAYRMTRELRDDLKFLGQIHPQGEAPS